MIWLVEAAVWNERVRGEDGFLERQEQLYLAEVRPLLERYCGDCHGGGQNEAGLDLDVYRTYLGVLEDRDRWLKLMRRVEGGEMPPPDAPGFEADDLTRLVSSLDTLLNQLDCDTLSRPGHVTIRRLNRFEYRNTVRDLTGVDYEPAAEFLGDDVGYGFDNIGDVLSLPPLLMEKYLDAAREISERAIVARPMASLELRTRGVELRGTHSYGDERPDAGALVNQSAAELEIEVPVDARYEFRIEAFGDQAGDESVKMALRVDGRNVKEFEVRATGDAPSSYTARVALKEGTRRVAIDFLNDFYQPDHPDPAQRDRNLVILELQVRGPVGRGVRLTKLPESHERLVFTTPADASPEAVAAAAEQVVRRLASRAFRRPATEQEIARLTDLVRLPMEEGETFESGVQLALQAVLVSPHFLYKVEQPVGEVEERRELDDFELATSLSYFLWSTMPDDELFRVAMSGKLSESDELERQVRRMLADPKSEALVESFASQWLQLRTLEKFRPDRDRFPDFSDALRSDMQEETRRFVSEILRRDLPLTTLLDADFTYVNGRLATHYGIPGVEGDEFRRVTLSDGQRGGLLTHASILSVTSNPTRTSPVKRGKWVLENLLGTPPPPPAPGVMELEAQGQLTGTLREKMQQHRADPTCAVCHSKMDPIGFALENFDAIGRWRNEDENAPIDASGELPEGQRFTGARELQRILVQERRDLFVRCVSEKLMTYALGRGLRYYDACAVNQIVDSIEDRGLKFSDLVLEIVRSQAFRARSRSQSEANP